jgi:hypothetical protein
VTADAQLEEWQPMRQVDVQTFPSEHLTVSTYENDVYTATFFDRRDSSHGYLKITRHDEEECRDWRQFQSIKNEVCGFEREAVELYPAESRMVDESNAYHLFVAPEGQRFPFGSDERSVARPGELQPGGAFKQRAWQPGLRTGVDARA